LPGNAPRAIETHANQINCVQPWQSLLGPGSPARNTAFRSVDTRRASGHCLRHAADQWELTSLLSDRRNEGLRSAVDLT